MKLSVSAYRAQASAHKKILCNYQHQLSYGATTQAARTTSDPAAVLSGLKVDRAENEEAQGGGLAQSSYPGASSSRMGPGLDSGSSAPSSVPHSLATSHDDEDNEDDESSSRRAGGTRTKSNQRWMKLRTTVQLSSAISTIQKKPPLKREDSFLKRFSTRQIPESQETLDTGEGEGDTADDKDSSRRRRRPRKPQRPPKTVVNPDENFYYYWLMLLSACVLHNLWTLIVRQSLPELQAMAPAAWLACDGFTDLIFFLDVGVQFRTGYLEQGLMVYNNKKLAGHYLKSKSFILDLLALLPLDLLQVNLGSNPMLRFPRFLKVYRVYNYYYMVESRTVYPNLWRVLNLIHILLILAHWFGCFYYLLSEAEGFQGDWVYPYRPGEYATLARKYLGSLYWSTLTLTTIGDLPTPETNAEYVFTIVSYLIGVFIFATIVGQVGNVITNRNANRLEFERLLDGAKTYMRHHKVPGGMKRRVLRWYDYSWSRGRIQGGGDINTALGLLPDKLKTELALHVNLSVLKKVTIFQECQPEFLHDLVLKMKAYIFTPGDSICRKGEVAREMFIIADGILEVISETGRVLTTMKAGDFFGEIGILNLDGLNKRTADVRSVGYSELFSLSREDVLAAMKDYPEAQEILQNLGRKRLMEAQRVARAFRHGVPTSPGHDSSDNSTGKRIVDKLKSDVKGLKNVLRKSRRVGRPDESMELQPLAPKVPPLRRQHKIDDDRIEETSASEPPVSPLGAGLPLLARLRLLKEKQEREEKRHLMETHAHPSDVTHSTVAQQSSADQLNPANPNLPLLQRILLLKNKTEVEPVVDKEAPAKEPLLMKKVSSEETQSAKLPVDTPKSSPVSVENGNYGSSKKPWVMLKNASLTARESAVSSPQMISPQRRSQIKQTLVQIRQQTKMYASVDDLSPEYCGLPFVKKLKILNERQKLAELEKAVRSSSLDCGENNEGGFNGSLTRSHSEACAIEYARKLARFNKEHPNSQSPSDPLSPENETLERRNLKSILKKLSSGSRAGSTDTSTGTSTPDPDVVSDELRKLMRAQTIEGYAARHSKLSKSVTFNKYTLQSPPSEQLPVEKYAEEKLSLSQEQTPLPPPNKISFRPLGTGGILQMVTRHSDDEYLGDLVLGIREVIQKRLEGIQSKFEHQFTSLELEIRKRDEIISQLQARIQELEQRELPGNDSCDDSTEPDVSMEEDAVDDGEDHPFMRDGSVDTVLGGTRPRLRRSSTVTEGSRHRRSWEEHSEEETLQLQDLPRSISPQNIWKDEVAIDLESNSDDSKSEDDADPPGRRRSADDYADDAPGHNNWEVTMLAQELENRRRNSEGSSPGS
ncbi:potassium/sodium hyperpolarization-activated cyclic nucleotide-gated channel 1 isoform X2 [Diachasma alloeum]|uniref:potassium/sodium hyperpolarization-activated cyclic nucleotide-gated channel 1 isoform X2 n=1 Tax=Diachasma alloeum TaxID=454923 RepID=UPI0010FB33B5|nr:potassium/sodium hyperpolarization-activated cyclic nucleotide-gated channel 1 isoform X2 [Diachasma alloeum]